MLLLCTKICWYWTRIVKFIWKCIKGPGFFGHSVHYVQNWLFYPFAISPPGWSVPCRICHLYNESARHMRRISQRQNGKGVKNICKCICCMLLALSLMFLSRESSSSACSLLLISNERLKVMPSSSVWWLYSDAIMPPFLHMFTWFNQPINEAINFICLSLDNALVLPTLWVPMLRCYRLESADGVYVDAWA